LEPINAIHSALEFAIGKWKADTRTKRSPATPNRASRNAAIERRWQASAAVSVLRRLNQIDHRDG